MKKNFPSTEHILEVLDKEVNQKFRKEEYCISELLSFEGEEFIENVYKVILQRPPDPGGLEHYLQGLENGIFTKEFIIGCLRYSKEGRQKGVKIRNLFWIYPFHVMRKTFFRILSKLKFIDLNRELEPSRKKFTQFKEDVCNTNIDDFFYASLEDAFRGEVEDIKESFLCYIPWVIELKNKFNNHFQVLDLGCGRGEWLCLVKEHGINGIGVDTNSLFIQRCREKDLNVVQEDVFEFLKKQKENSFSMITCFHLIEHLFFSQQYVLLSEIYRVLKPEGMAILETPNPRNILVSSGDFYSDPTHKKPVFPDTLEVLGKHLGFYNSTAFFFKNNRKELIPITDVQFRDLRDYVDISRDFVWRGIK